MNTYISNLPELIKEWHPSNNGLLDPNLLTSGSNKRVWWRCSNNQNHVWEALIYKRALSGRSCPYCAGKRVSIENSLATKYPEVSKEWYFDRNELKPTEVTYGSSKKVWWKCIKNHSWITAIKKRTIGGTNCPYCTNRKPSVENNLLNFPIIALTWNTIRNGDLKPENFTYGSEKIVWWKCKEGHEWESTLYNRTSGGNNCPICAKQHTNLERFIEEKLDIKKFDKCPLEKSEIKYKPDFQLSEDLYLNADGLYWHSELYRKANYHLQLQESFRLENKRILQFYEDEIYQKWPIIKSIINNSLGKSSIKLDARKCTIQEINDNQAKEFYEQNHLMGYYGFANHYGLCYNSGLVSLLSIRQKEHTLEISRFSSRLNTNVRGGFSKLLLHVIKEYKPRHVISFCDLRYATGKSYEALGFKKIGATQGWQWTDRISRFNRLQCRAGGGKTERENAAEKGWVKIYDAGQAKYVLEL